ncbi:nucleotidyltransferase domain-containing protein [Candidatus Micrarchaeota archaeon]|nr:nucleotidyltransferase domain-containing protein [Candidatus Micrarchaeota archaeon]
MLEKYAVLAVMKVILGRPAKRFSVREAAKATGLSVNACKYSLDFMLGKGMVRLEKIGKTYQYQASLDSYMARQWKVLFSLEELDGAGIVQAILKTGRSIMSIILYGSTAMGRDDAASDIDVLVIADTDMAGKKSIAALAHGTRREINISVYSPYEWREKAKRDRVFYEQAVMDCIVLYGERPVVL